VQNVCVLRKTPTFPAFCTGGTVRIEKIVLFYQYVLIGEKAILQNVLLRADEFAPFRLPLAVHFSENAKLRSARHKSPLPNRHLPPRNGCDVVAQSSARGRTLSF
jgi:hypothetical protein